MSHSSVFDWSWSGLNGYMLLQGNHDKISKTDINADGDIIISGKNTGIDYITVYTAETNVVSKHKNIYIFGR